jgi:hypothetical protein
MQSVAQYSWSPKVSTKKYDRFFLVPVSHVETCGVGGKYFVKLIYFENQIILDHFLQSCSTRVASLKNKRKFIEYELDGK